MSSTLSQAKATWSSDSMCWCEAFDFKVGKVVLKDRNSTLEGFLKMKRL